MRRKLGELVHDISEITHDMRLEIPSLRLRRNCVGYTRVVLNDKEPVHTAPPKSFHWSQRATPPENFDFIYNNYTAYETSFQEKQSRKQKNRRRRRKSD